ncbi:hypothetical protein DFS34DRAFT_687714 [Phlyctochytrium arcticum]|nr:hypothetical protein DFS34DRAFT_687714 [Phlyctochytrium arcticum]
MATIYLSNDPHCTYSLDANYSVVLGYNGVLSHWDSIDAACTGINVWLGNIAIVLISVCISGYTVFYSSRTIVANGLTKGNGLVLAGAVSVWLGMLLELAAVVDHWQLGGRPEWGHLCKVFWFGGIFFGAWAQPIRLDFILISRNKPRRWARTFHKVYLTVALVFGMMCVLLFAIGVHNGPGAAKREMVHYIIPWVLVNFGAAVLDLVLSVYIIKACHDQHALLHAKDIEYYNVNAGNVVDFARRNKFAAVMACTGDVVFASLYLAGSFLNLGSTVTYMGTISIASTWWFVTYSLSCMRESIKDPARTPSANTKVQGSMSESATGSAVHGTARSVAVAECRDI